VITLGASSLPSEVVMELLAAEDGPVPFMLVALTEKLYAVALSKPVMMSGLVAPEAVKLPGEEVTV
jgi:hypothetical protein